MVITSLPSDNQVLLSQVFCTLSLNTLTMGTHIFGIHSSPERKGRIDRKRFTGATITWIGFLVCFLAYVSLGFDLLYSQQAFLLSYLVLN